VDRRADDRDRQKNQSENCSGIDANLRLDFSIQSDDLRFEAREARRIACTQIAIAVDESSPQLELAREVAVLAGREDPFRARDDLERRV